MYIKKRNSLPPTLEELEQKYTELLAQYSRRHGRTAKLSTDPEERYKQLYKNVKSIESRMRSRKLEQKAAKSFVEKFGFGNDDADIYGITSKDRRRYIAKFKNCPYGSRVQLDYVRRMTGLTLNQIYILQNETGKYPYPPVTKKAAAKDEAYRNREAIYI